MRANQGKSVAVTILRERKQQVLTLQVDSKKKGEVEFPGLLPDGPCPLMAFADTDPLREMLQHLDQPDMQSQLKQWNDQFGNNHFGLTPEQADELRRQAEQFSQAFKDNNFLFDQKQLKEFQNEMQEFSKNFKPDQFGFDANQMKELQQQMQEWQKNFDPKAFQFDQKQLDELNRQMQEFQKAFPQFE
jgi:molecular chaperone DnaK (HSP70)